MSDMDPLGLMLDGVAAQVDGGDYIAVFGRTFGDLVPITSTFAHNRDDGHHKLTCSQTAFSDRSKIVFAFTRRRVREG